MRLETKLTSRTARVAVIGLGYVGLPQAVALADAGFPVVGIDVDAAKVARLRAGQSYVDDVPDATIRRLIDSGRLEARSDFDALGTADVVTICVPTPLSKTKDPDVSYIRAATAEVARHLHPGQLVILESTTYPGTTDELVRPSLEATGLTVGKDVFLAFSPERIDPGNAQYRIDNTPKVVGGFTRRCSQLAAAFYGQFVGRVVPVSSARTAEMVKLLENTFRLVNIALVNELSVMSDVLGVDINEVIQAAASKPFGFMPFYPGPGLGGHCIPVDPEYLAWKLKGLDRTARFISLAGEINASMPRVVVSKVGDALNTVGKSINGARVLVLGVAYKRDVSDTRESPALPILSGLRQRGARVVFHDPHVPRIQLDGAAVDSVRLSNRLLAAQDCTVLATDHRAFDIPAIVAASRLFVDTRNATSALAEFQHKIVRLGAPSRLLASPRMRGEAA
jgi:UDP-N-acetyl-D-glucosamine dehydrogenase